MPARIHNFLGFYEQSIRNFFRKIWDETPLGGYLKGFFLKPDHYATLSPSRVKALSMQVVNSLKEKLFKAIPATSFSADQCAKLGEAQLLYLIRARALLPVTPHLNLETLSFTLKQPEVAKEIVPTLSTERLEALLEPKFKLESELKKGLTVNIVRCWNRFIGKGQLQPASSKVHALMLRVVTKNPDAELIPTLTTDQLLALLKLVNGAAFYAKLGKYMTVEQLLDLIKVIRPEDPAFTLLCRLMSHIDNPLLAAVASRANTLGIEATSFCLQFRSCASLAAQLSETHLIKVLHQFPEGNFHKAFAESLTDAQYSYLILQEAGVDPKVAKLLSSLSKEKLKLISDLLIKGRFPLTFLPRLFNPFSLLAHDPLLMAFFQQLSDKEMAVALGALPSSSAVGEAISRTVAPVRFAQVVAEMSSDAAKTFATLPETYAACVQTLLTSDNSLLLWFHGFEGHSSYRGRIKQLNTNQLLALRNNPAAHELFLLGFAGKEEVSLHQILCPTLGDDTLSERVCGQLKDFSDLKLQNLFTHAPQAFIQKVIQQLKITPNKRVEQLLIQHHKQVETYVTEGSVPLESRVWLFERWGMERAGLLYRMRDPLLLLSTCKPLTANKLRILTRGIPTSEFTNLLKRSPKKEVNVTRLLPLFNIMIPHRHQILTSLSTMSPAQIKAATLDDLTEEEFEKATEELLAPDNSEWCGQWSELLDCLGPIRWKKSLGVRSDPRLCAGLLLKSGDPREILQYLQRDQLEETVRVALLLNRSSERELTAFFEALKMAGYSPGDYLPLFDHQTLFSPSSQKVLQKLWQEHVPQLEQWEKESQAIKQDIATLIQWMGNTPFGKLERSIREKTQELLAKIMPHLAMHRAREPFVGLHFLARVHYLLEQPENVKNAPQKGLTDSFHSWYGSHAHVKKKLALENPLIEKSLATFDKFYADRLQEQTERLALLDNENPTEDIFGFLGNKSVVFAGKKMRYIWKEFALKEEQLKCITQHLDEIQSLKACCKILPDDSIDTLLEKLVAYTLNHPTHI